jgi:hypothetical protein
MDAVIDRLWSAADTATFLGVPIATLHQWRYLHTGPKAYRVGRWLRYDPAEVVAWVKGGAA